MRSPLAVALRCPLIAFVFLLLALQASAAPVVVKAARMPDVTSGEMVADPVVVVDRGRIVGMGPAAEPEGAEVIDLGELTLLPGLTGADRGRPPGRPDRDGGQPARGHLHHATGGLRHGRWTGGQAPGDRVAPLDG